VEILSVSHEELSAGGRCAGAEGAQSSLIKLFRAAVPGGKHSQPTVLRQPQKIVQLVDTRLTFVAGVPRLDEKAEYQVRILYPVCPEDVKSPCAGCLLYFICFKSFLRTPKYIYCFPRVLYLLEMCQIPISLCSVHWHQLK
jgi:hypothetical protein